MKNSIKVISALVFVASAPLALAAIPDPSDLTGALTTIFEAVAVLVMAIVGFFLTLWVVKKIRGR